MSTGNRSQESGVRGQGSGVRSQATAASPSHRATVSPSQPRARVALLGCGTVGREVARRLLAEGERLGVELVRVLVRDTTRDRGIPRELITDRFEDVLDSEPGLVIEAIGGLEPAADHVRALLGRGLHVVTANKTLVAHRGTDLQAIADETGAGFAYEATVCAAVPVLAAVRRLAADGITSIRGVINGTCNFILTRLGEGRSFEEALAEARARGFAEPDPSADLSGRDSAEKLCVLAAAAGSGGVTPDRVACEGIERITPDDVREARRRGREVRLVAELEIGREGPALRVGPTLVGRDHPLWSVRDEENAVVISTRSAGEVVLRGRGAGPAPTTGAILGDVAALLGGRPRTAGGGARQPERRHSIHIPARGDPPGPDRALGAAASLGIGLDEVEFRRGATRLRTAPTTEAAARACGAAIAGDRDGVLVMPEM